jgi:hypothetical protein
VKRFTSQELAHPKIRGAHADVAGGLSVHALSRALACDVASFRLAEADPVAAARQEAELLNDFADFMMGDLDGEGVHSAPDPIFREQLRGRLWQLHALTTQDDRGEPN